MKCLGGGFTLRSAARTCGENSPMLSIALVNFDEVPGSDDDLGVVLAPTSAGLEQDHLFNVRGSSSENGALFGEGVRGDPNAVLKIAKAPLSEVAPQFVSHSAPRLWYIEQDEPPATVPSPTPPGHRIASTERPQTSQLG